MAIFNLYTATRTTLVTAAILLLVTPSPSAGGPCDCSTCQSYSDQKSRCLCCVYHGVGGKRSVLEPASASFLMPSLSPMPPPVHFLMTSGLSNGRATSRLLEGATSGAKDGGDNINRGWYQTGAAVSSHPGFRRRDTNEDDFRLEPVLAVKSRAQKEALGTSGAVEDFRRLFLQAGSV